MSDSAVIEYVQPSEPPKQAKGRPAAFSGLPGVDWLAIQMEFIRGATLTELERKHGICLSTLSARCSREGWSRKRKLAQTAQEALQGAMQHPCKMTTQDAESAVVAVDLASEALRWKEQTYARAMKIAKGIDSQSFEDGQSKKLAEVAAALASIDSTARRQLGLDIQDAEDFGGVARHTGRPGERPIMRRAQVIDVSPAEVSTPEAFDPGI